MINRRVEAELKTREILKEWQSHCETWEQGRILEKLITEALLTNGKAQDEEIARLNKKCDEWQDDYIKLQSQSSGLMSEEEIEQAIYDIPEEYADDFCDEHITDIAKVIHTAMKKKRGDE